ncbi:MAG: EAL domain-containing protein [Burkholderiaceae bacterium]|nr:EAL domain-containing protein [Burkholderiaceae bacterium]
MANDSTPPQILRMETSADEDHLSQMADMLRRTGELAKVGAWELDLRTRKFMWSDETFRINDLEPEQPPSVEETLAMYAEPARTAMAAAMEGAIKYGHAYDLELPKTTATGRQIWVRAQASAVCENGVPVKLFGALQDITERKQVELFEQLRSELLEGLARGVAFNDTLEKLVLGVERLRPGALCSILLLDEQKQYLATIIAPSLPTSYNKAIAGTKIGIGQGSCGTSAFTGKMVIVEDIATHPYWTLYRELALAAQLGSCWSHPFFDSNGAVIGTFAVYYHTAHAPEAYDICLIEKVASLASIAFEKNHVEALLRESEANFRLLIEGSAFVFWKHNREGYVTYVSPVDEKMRGYSAAEVVGTHASAFLTPDGMALLERKRHLWRDLYKTSPTDSMTLEFEQRCKNGTWIWTEVIVRAVRDAKGYITGFHGITRDITQQRKTEEALRIAAIAFEAQEGMYICNMHWQIVRINKAFTDITGFTAGEAVGRTPELMHSNRHDVSFYSAMAEILERDGAWQGEIWDKRKDGEIIPLWLTITVVKDDNQTPTHYVGTFTDISSRKNAEEKIKSLAFYDPLTSLPNRRLLMERLEHAMSTCLRHQRRGALLFVDLDNFKELNDTYGHDRGDLLLQEVACRLLTCTRVSDTVARLGGDEFVIMLEDLSDDEHEAASQVEMVAEKIIRLLNQKYMIAGDTHQSTPSIGVTLFGDISETIEEPLKRADMAMYQAKSAGRNTVRFFDPKMQAEVNARINLENALREGITQNQFVLAYQAQVRQGTEVSGAEVLVRWQHPQRGMVSPAEFIPLAEETGMIIELGNWVLQSACQQLAHWQQLGQAEFAALTIAVNVSPRQFHQIDFVERVLSILQSTGANPRQLKLELTEGMLITHVEDVVEKMRQLKVHGVGFSLDDFGTGYSSLSYLKRLPLDQLKIDQSFVRDILVDPNDAAIAKMIIVLAESLGLQVIAEGVESKAQCDYLSEHGCHAYQGYFFSKPVPLVDFEKLVKSTSMHKNSLVSA